ncbi:MAG: hypothetical protein GF308_21950 [Candidatus Heimdallarchaeota archaeon]|nr:hypothetical protein [Candidatus Heimdallarchaeota archaeon]
MGKPFFEPTTLSFSDQQMAIRLQVLTSTVKLQLMITNGNGTKELLLDHEQTLQLTCAFVDKFSELDLLAKEPTKAFVEGEQK